MKFSRFILPFICFLPAFKGIQAQEIRGLTGNPVIREYRHNRPVPLKSASANAMLTLPFFEDFSTSDVLPDPAKWADDYVYINNSFALDPISIGVATLDAIDQFGELYATSNLPTSSDKLTTLPFDLSPYAGGTDTVRLSFFFQAGGKGEVPELQDSLLLEFYSPEKDSWKRAWFATANAASPFKQVIVPVDTEYYKSGFRFRFRNYTTISTNDVTGGKGALSNADCWNIDYIMMNTLPASEHQNIHDITLVDQPRKLMDFYESIPWTHVNEAQSIMLNDIHYIIRNLSGGDSVNVGRTYYVRNPRTGSKELYEDLFSKIPPLSLSDQPDPFFAPFTQDDHYSEGAREVVSYLITPAGQVKSNDTCRITIHFRNYYAYDDGSPEYGFGISGESTSGALLAMRFRIYRADTLRAIQFLFNKTRDHYTANLKFQTCVWKDAGGIPGDLIYISPESFSPGDDPQLFGFTTCALPSDTSLVITDTSVFVGWKQVTEDFLNLGYDVNRNNLDRTFVNISGTWFNPGNSLIPGTPMIRAVFGSKNIITGTPDIPATDHDIQVYPNPASGIVHISSAGFTVSRIRLMDMQGRVLLEERGDPHEFDVTGLPAGIYLLQLCSPDGTLVNRKMVIHH
jgi:hypothetical protein